MACIGVPKACPAIKVCLPSEHPRIAIEELYISMRGSPNWAGVVVASDVLLTYANELRWA
jgi:hypothetical protein